MKSSVSVLGSTGSIGKNTLEVIEALGLRVTALAAGKNSRLMAEQARRFSPRLVAMSDEAAANEVRLALADTDIRVLSGEEGVAEAAALEETDTVVGAITGMAGLVPSLTAIRAKKRLALANKETLVCGGRIVRRELKRTGAEMLPVDSEPSAIFQCLAGGGEVKRLVLTASGGPFLGKTASELEGVTVGQALAHPNWSMGPKVTVDSATMMNKGLELIEAMYFFDLPEDKISIYVHPQSIVHSMAEFVDGSVVAQLGAPDMRLPIQLALTWPERVPGPAKTLDLTKTAPLTFLEPDTETFACLRLAREVARGKSGDAAVMNGANEAAVAAFLAGRIGFGRIYPLVAAAVEKLGGAEADSVDEVVRLGREAERFVYSCI
ncbi:MAG: 1-deoxy-D-xylulose-5-phosphate reductoisomerase [Oscillospiraceae bacterium]|nr:1-deoxy-D-xylulose-5-phosphate reductoisomerase [Oscillospiraceae bacterium]